MSNIEVLDRRLHAISKNSKVADEIKLYDSTCIESFATKLDFYYDDIERIHYNLKQYGRVLCDSVGEPCYHKTREESYIYVPVPFYDILSLMETIKPFEKKTFIDAGCGLGIPVLLFAQQIGYVTTGVDFCQEYVIFAREFLPQCKIEQKDIMDVDYGQYEVIYFYCPFLHSLKEEEFEKYVFESMKSGSIVLNMDGRLSPTCFGFIKIADNCFQKQ